MTSVYEVSMKVCLLLLILTTESSGGQIAEAIKKVLTNVFIIMFLYHLQVTGNVHVATSFQA